jgi:4-hydroxythreonine-4-phosphate dehydrogenase
MTAENPNAPRPTIGISMGDPSGIGPEIVVKALADREVRGLGRFVVYGLNELMAYAADELELEPYWFRVQHDSSRTSRPIREDVVVLDFDEFDGLMQSSPRRPTKAGGLASRAFVEESIADALAPPDHARHLDALVTGPISKEAWQLAGFNWPGHTELLARRTRAKRHAMMFVSPRLRVILATAHLPLCEIRNVLTIGRVFDPIDLGHQACRELGIEEPVIAITGLNPHAGEGGLLGDEEIRLIAPAIEMARQGGINARGPFPADTVFVAAASGAFDLVVAMYHDQGLIPVKLLGWESAVNWTVGLPIIRTSPDHGTAFDIAGTCTASAGSMKAAIGLAARLASARLAAAVDGATRTEPAA